MSERSDKSSRCIIVEPVDWDHLSISDKVRSYCPDVVILDDFMLANSPLLHHLDRTVVYSEAIC